MSRKIVGSSVAFIFALSSSDTRAGQTWDGGAGTGNWADINNWNPDGLPAFGTPIIFTGIVGLSTNNNTTATTTGISFDALAGGFTLAGNAVTNSGDIVNSSAALQTLNLGISLGNSQTWQTTTTGGMAVNGNVNLSGFTLTTSALSSGDITISGVVSGPSGIIHNSGRLILLGANTYFGNTTVAGGTLQVGNGVAVGSAPGMGSVFVQPTGTLDVNLANGASLNNPVVTNVGAIVQGTNTVGNTQFFDGTISGGASLRQIGAGTTVLRQANTYTGGTVINAGILQVGDGAASGSAGQNIGTNAISVENEGRLVLTNVANGGVLNNNITNNLAGTFGHVSINSIQSIELTGTITDGAGQLDLLQSGAGTTTLSNAGNTYTGSTTVNAGTLQIGKTGVGGSIGATSAVFVNTGGTLSIVNIGGPVPNTLGNAISNNLGGTGTVLVNSVNTNTLSGNITNGAGALALTQSGAGTTILTGAGNTYTGATTITAGTLQLGQGGVNGGLAPASNIINNGTLVFDGAAQTYANTISGTGNLVKQQNTVTTLTGTNTYSGLTTISAGTLRVGSATALGSTIGGTVLAAGATLDLNGQDIGAEPLQVQGIGDGLGAIQNTAVGTGISSGPITLTGDTTIGTASGPITLNGAIGGAFALTKIGAGTLTLAGVNAYNGTTSVNAGVLVVGNNNALGSVGAGTTVAAGAALSLANGVSTLA